MNASTQKYSLSVIIAFAIVYIVWGSTYLANIYAIESFPPFILVASRLTVAGLIILGLKMIRAFASLKRNKSVPQGELVSATIITNPNFSIWPTKTEFKNLFTTSFLILTIGLGSLVYAEKFIDSGTTALLVALEPLAVVLILWAFERKTPRWQAFVGIAIGILGTTILVGQDVMLQGEGIWIGIAAIMISIISWGIGSVLISRVSLPKDKMKTAGWQMLIAGLVAVPIAYFSGEFQEFDVNNIHQSSLYAWGFLVLFGSVIAYSAYVYLLQRVSPEKVATSTYVHPVVALVLGATIRGEEVTMQTGIACAVLIIGVVFVNGNWGRRKRSALVQPYQSLTGAIIRRWKGKAIKGQEDQLAVYLEKVILPDIRKQEGNLGATMWRNTENPSEISIESKWENDKALKKFTEGDIIESREYEGLKEYLDPNDQEIRNDQI